MQKSGMEYQVSAWGKNYVMLLTESINNWIENCTPTIITEAGWALNKLLFLWKHAQFFDSWGDQIQTDSKTQWLSKAFYWTSCYITLECIKDPISRNWV